jgi:DNA polymerase-3 subunit beta
MRISSQSAEYGEAGEVIAIDYQGNKVTVSFNATYLNDVLNALGEDEILFEIKNGETPAKFSIKTADLDHCLGIVMPLMGRR